MLITKFGTDISYLEESLQQKIICEHKNTSKKWWHLYKQATNPSQKMLNKNTEKDQQKHKMQN